MNMSYCRFENTYQDLRDCYDAMERQAELQSSGHDSDLSQSEANYKQRLIALCQTIVEDFTEKD